MHQRFARIVEHADIAGIFLRIPEDRPGIVELGDVLADLVGAPADARRVDGVGHRVLRAHVIERALQRVPDIGRQIGDVAVVDRLDQLAGHGLGQAVRGDIDDIGPDRMGRLLGDGLVLAVIGGELHVDAMGLAELVHQPLVDVVGIDIDDEIAAGFRRHAGLEGVLIDRQRHRMVGPRQRNAARAHGLGAVGKSAADDEGCRRGDEAGAADGLQRPAARERAAHGRTGRFGVRITIFHGCPLLFWQCLCDARLGPPGVPEWR